MADADHRPGSDLVARLDLPPRLDLPVFAYGPLLPGEPAHTWLLTTRVDEIGPGHLSGGLRLRDGLPLFDPDGTGGVPGTLLAPAKGQAADVYPLISAYAPRQHYRWLATSVATEGGRTVMANTLVGRHPERGSADGWRSTWSAADEPVLRAGVDLVRRRTLEILVEGAAPDAATPAAWTRYFEIHGLYLALWAAVERFSALALGPAEPPLVSLYRLGDDPRFRECVLAAGVTPSPKTPDSRDPARTRRIRADGGGAMFSWEALRSHMGHPGSDPGGDSLRLRRALVDLHDTFRLLLLSHVPALAGVWQVLDPAGAPHRWLLRPALGSEHSF
ncbi:MAG: hypothetical protein ACT4OS_04935 [Acidimicrobiales bacterium]